MPEAEELNEERSALAQGAVENGDAADAAVAPPSRAALELDGHLQELFEEIQRQEAGEEPRDGSLILPDDATVEPGALLYRIHEVWTREPGKGNKETAHSFANLSDWSGRILSAQHKLKGRLPLVAEEAESLLRAMLLHWTGDEPHPALPLWEAEQLDPPQRAARAARGLARILFGPIYGLGEGTRIVRMRSSPGTIPATFMRRQRKKEAKAVVFLMTDQSANVEDPAGSLDDTRLTFAQYLSVKEQGSEERKQEDPSGHIIYVLRSQGRREDLGFVRWLYKSRLLAILFRLLQVTADKRWQLEHLPGRLLPKWRILQNRIWVFSVPSGELADLLVPLQPPAEWQRVEYTGLIVVAPKTGNLTYWKYERGTGAVSEIAGRNKAMEKALNELVNEVIKSPDVTDQIAPAVEHLSLPSDPECKLRLLNAEAFMHSKDLEG